MNLEQCRLCGKNNGLTDVFDEEDLGMKVFVCFGVKIQKDDEITKKICKSCYFFANSVYEYRLSSNAFDKKLWNEYTYCMPKVEPKPAPQTEPKLAPQIDPKLAPQNEPKPAFQIGPKPAPTTKPKAVPTKPKAVPTIEPKPAAKIEQQLVPIVKPYPAANIKPNSTAQPASILYPSEISQDDFLNTFDLAHKSDEVLHPSILRLKRKYPNVIIPSECFESNVDAFVLLDTLAKVPRLDSDSDLGIWSVKKKQIRGKQADLILTRVHSESDSGCERSRRSSESVSPQRKKTRNNNHKYPVYGGRRSTRKVKKNLNTRSESKQFDERITLKSLLQTDAEFNMHYDMENMDNTDSLENLLVSRGEEVRTFICQTCNKIFDTLQMLNQHKKYNHKSSLRCDKCSMSFSIVENLVNHNLTCHRETTGPIKPTVVELKTVARKKTSGSVSSEPRSEPIAGSSKDIIEYIISSDEEVDNQIENFTPEPPQIALPPQPLENVISAALEPPAKCAEDNLFLKAAPNLLLKAALTPKLPENQDKSKVETLIQKENEEVFLIDDSDDEADDPLETTNNETFLIDETSEDSSRSKEVIATLHPLSLPLIDDLVKDMGQSIVVVPSVEDKDHMDPSSSLQETITNENNYINYIFNKCSFLDKPKNEKRYFLKDIHRFTEKTYLPIEVLKTTNDELSIEYVPKKGAKPRERVAFWADDDVISARKVLKPPTPAEVPTKVVLPSSNPLLKPVQPVSPSRGQDPKTMDPELIKVSNGYILMGVTTDPSGILQPVPNVPIILGNVEETNKINIPKPIVLNGMTMSGISKLRNQSPTIVLQPNVSIQNCINISQETITTTEFATISLPVPVVVENPNQSVVKMANPLPEVVNSLPNVIPTAQVQPGSSTTTSTDLAVLTPKPTIRIKNLAELRGDMNINQRNELHSLYTNALTNYVQNHSSTVSTARSQTDEYLQIS